MESTVLNLTDMFARELSIPWEKAKKMEAVFRELAKEEAERALHKDVAKTLERTAPPLVERAVATELKHLATKAELKDEIHAMEQRLSEKMDSLLKWTITSMVAILLSIIALMAISVFAQKPINIKQPTTETTEQINP